MAFSKILYVDNIENVTYGITSEWASIRHNIQSINSESTKDFSNMLGKENESTTVDIAGKYIFFLTGSLDEHDKAMVFFDCENDVVNAVNFCSAVFHGKQLFIDMFMSRFKELEPKYEQQKSLFILKVGRPS